ncbi:hypothetical protein NW767_002226 [Fusarium falciforme]|nr:hypothetical protein NW767_002226 [Fusarium falciforme]
MAFVLYQKNKHGSFENYNHNPGLGCSARGAPRAAPFEFEDDYKILHNDAPYGIDPRIVHLVVWTKFDLVEDPATGDLADGARQEIDDFVTTTFRANVPNEHVIDSDLTSVMDKC